MFLRFKPFEASWTFQFKDPDTAFTYHSHNLTELYRRIILYRQQNNLEMIEELPQVVENYLCGLPENVGKCQENIELDRKFTAYVKGGVSLLKNMLFGLYAKREVAEKRALQCVSCPNNVFPDKGAFLKWSDDIAIAQVGERKVTVHEQLGSCKVCSCPLRSKVFFEGKIAPFPEEELVELKKVSCWQLSLSGQE